MNLNDYFPTPPAARYATPSGRTLFQHSLDTGACWMTREGARLAHAKLAQGVGVLPYRKRA